ncbi:MAG: DUF2400 family protein [Bacteroidia bacterium]|nr:DUF2400 family protein [Bacteroidia bacterium]
MTHRYSPSVDPADPVKYDFALFGIGISGYESMNV